MSVRMRECWSVGVAVVVLTLLVGMLSAPTAAASSGSRAAQSEETYCQLTPPEPPGDTLFIYPVYDPENGNIGGLSAHWVGLFECTPVATGNAVQEIDVESQLWYEDVVAVGIDQVECALIDGDPTCDDVPTDGIYICDTGFDCSGKYHATFIAHIVMRPGVSWYTIPDYCNEVQPPPLQVVDCDSESNTIVVPPTSGG